MPVVTIGERAGDIGNNKDTRVTAGATAFSGGSGTTHRLDGAPMELVFIRFDLSSIPVNATINSAIMSFILTAHTQAGAAEIIANRMTTNWGVTPTNAGALEDPATGGQATYRRSFDFNGAGGDVVWAGGGNFAIANDTDAVVLDNVPVGAGDPIGTQYDLTVTNGVAQQVLDDATNYGYTVYMTTNVRKAYGGLLNAADGNKPFLTVDYTEAAGGVVGQSRIAMTNAIGIGL